VRESISADNKRMLVSCFLGTTVFKAALERAPPERVPLLAVLRRCKIPSFQVLFCAMAESSTFCFTSVFGLTYGVQTLGLDNTLLLSGLALGNAIGILTNPLAGGLSDRPDRRPLIVSTHLLSALYVMLLFFPTLSSGTRHLSSSRWRFPGALLQPPSIDVTGSFYPELFDDPKLRLSAGHPQPSIRHGSRRRIHADDLGFLARDVGRQALLGHRLFRARLRRRDRGRALGTGDSCSRRN